MDSDVRRHKLTRLGRELGVDKIALRRLLFDAAMKMHASGQCTPKEAVEDSIMVLEEVIEQTQVKDNAPTN